MAEDFTTMDVPQWTGSRLSYGSFLAYATRVAEIVRETGYAELALETTGPELEAAVGRLAEALKKSATYDETVEVVRADRRRDVLWLALWYAWKFTLKLGLNDPLGEAAAKLRSEMLAAKDVYRHEMSRQTAEMEALRRNLATPECEAALRSLGLDTIAQAMFAANDEWQAADTQRDSERGARIAKVPKGEYAVARKNIVPLLAEAIRNVNAVNRIAPTEASRACAASLLGTIASYRSIAAQPRHRRKKKDDGKAAEETERTGAQT